MVRIKAKLKVRRSAYRLEVKGRLTLPFASRQARGLKAKLDSGEEVVLDLPQGEVLRGGDLVTASDGRVIEVLAAAEKLLQIESEALAKIAYHLGERHVPAQVGDGFLRIAADHALEEVVTKLGAKVSHVEAPFEPDVGADAHHAHDHRHDHDHDHHHHHGRGHKH
jgi:urease accessory protein